MMDQPKIKKKMLKSESRYKSGAAKRRVKALMENERKNMKNSMKNFFTTATSHGTTNVDGNMDGNVILNSQSAKYVDDKKESIYSEELTHMEMEEDMVTQNDKTKTCNEEEDMEVSQNGKDKTKTCNEEEDMEVSQNGKDKTKTCNEEEDMKVTHNEKTKMCNENEVELIPSNDPALWEKEHFEDIREYFSQTKPHQNIEKLHTSKRLICNKERKLSKNNFFRKKQNNELVCRDWLIYSESKCALFCFICKLYSSCDQALCNQGFTDWKNVSKRLSEHESSSIHRQSVCLHSKRLSAKSRIDCIVVEEYEKECKYWQNVLRRTVAVIKYLCVRGLPMFGSNETISSPHNGNFLGCIELLSLFDPFMANHLTQYGNIGKGKTNYLSSTIVNELISVMGECVQREIVTEIAKSKYYGIIVDSTPDVSHIDQLSIVIRYTNEQGQPIERLIKLEPIYCHTSSSLCETILSVFETLKIDIKNCRGQSFDNASNMAGRYSGLQARIKAESPLAEFVPCSAHSLNLVISVAVECCHQVIGFFGLLQNVYNFFSASTHRWEILTSNLSGIEGGFTVKSLSGTRWSACAEASKALRKGYVPIKNALKCISDDTNEKNNTRHEAKSILLKLEQLENVILLIVWDSVLQRTDKVNKTLQGPTCSLAIVVPLYNSLITFVGEVRNSFDSFETDAFELLGAHASYKDVRKKKTPKSRMLDDSQSEEVVFDNRQSFICECFYVLCDSLLMELKKRKDAYLNLEEKFGFLYEEFSADTKAKIYTGAKTLQKIYSVDLDADFPDEFLQFRSMNLKSCDPELQLKTLKELNIEHTFPNVETCLRIFLSMPISNCSSERSFSALKRIKKFLRSNLRQPKLNNLSVLAVENDITSKLNFEEVIKIFAEKKCRKKPL